MKQAASRNIKGIGFDAQAAAREAARREGKSLGEWLHGVIADHAAEFGGGGSDEIAGQERVDAVTSRLERLSSHASASSQRPVRARQTEAQRAGSRPIETRLSEDATMPGSHRWHASPRVDDAESLLEDAIEQMDRVAARSERRTEEALATVAKMMETGEARRSQEHEAVTALTQKMASIESRLTQQFAATDNPVKGALARLEARLELIGKRNAAESEARSSMVKSETAMSESAASTRQFEDKLNAILRAVEIRAAQPVAEISEFALRAAQRPETAAARRSLGDAIAEISKRQQSLEDPAWSGRERLAVREPVPRPSMVTERRANVVHEPSRAAFRASDPSSFVTSMPAATEGGIADLIAKVDEMRRDLAANREGRRSTTDSDLDGVRSDIAAMSRTLQDFIPRAPVTATEDAIHSLAARFDKSVRSAGAASRRQDIIDDTETRLQIGSLEKEVRTIADKVDALRSAGIDRDTAELLQDRMKDLGDAAASLRAMITTAPGALALEKIEQRLEALADKVEEALVRAPRVGAIPQPKLDTSALECLVRELGDKIEAVQAPSVDSYAMEALQQQVEQLSERFARSEQGLSHSADACGFRPRTIQPARNDANERRDFGGSCRAGGTPHRCG